MRVVVFRARDDGLRTAERLRAHGHDAVLAPVLQVVPTGEPVPSGPFDGVIFTSAHGVEALPNGAATPLLDRPCFCVGERTATTARSAGFSDPRSGRADAERLATLVAAAFAAPARLLLLAGRDRKPAIERRLAAAGHRVQVAELYEAKAIERWDEATEAAFATHTVDAALHFSRRSAALALDCAETGQVRDGLLRLRHFCLSEDSAVPLRAAGASAIAVAAEPTEDSLIDRLAGPSDGRDE